MLAYLAVFALTIGTVITFGLVTAVTTESYTSTYAPSCPAVEELPPEMSQQDRDQVLRQCQQAPQTYQSSRPRTDRTWWLLAPNPFVILADSAPALPPETQAERDRRQADQSRGIYRQDARDLDPLGQIGQAVRGLRRPPDDTTAGAASYTELSGAVERDRPRSVWPYGLAFDVALAVGALLLTRRRLQTPSRTLAVGQRVA